MENLVDLTVEQNYPKHVIEVSGIPQALPRARTSWKSYNKHYNPACKKLSAFKEVVKAAIPDVSHGYVYARGVCVSITIICYMKRPNSDFTNNDRGFGRLKCILPTARANAPDIDNLAKFILDGLNRLVYEDDRQVVKLNIYKLLDNNGDCLGKTIICISEYDPNKDVPTIPSPSGLP
jgi:Holliday junction resolvase RusA-like endonuclease